MVAGPHLEFGLNGPRVACHVVVVKCQGPVQGHALLQLLSMVGTIVTEVLQKYLLETVIPLLVQVT